MKRLLLDTNIYGEMVVDRDLFKLKEAHKQKKELVIYGLRLIRNELRATSKNKDHLGRNLRVALLSLYDEFVAEHELRVEEEELIKIARKYYEIYWELGGHKAKEILLNDYLIVACAAMKKMDIVVSNDEASMLSELSLKAYQIVNELLELKNPQFINYKELKSLILG